MGPADSSGFFCDSTMQCKTNKQINMQEDLDGKSSKEIKSKCSLQKRILFKN
jgi:hypothetical protein